MTWPRVVLVTGTDTGVGKTVATAALAAGAPGRVAVVKPVQTGADAGEPGDLDEVRRLTGLTDLHEGARLAAPLAPTSAARLAGVRPPGVDEHAHRIDELASTRDLVLVEGAGGLLVGLDAAGRDLTDLAAHLTGPAGFVVVVRAALGTLNHARLTVEALRARRLSVLGLVIGCWPDDPDLAARHNLADLPAVTGVPLLGRIPAGAGALDAATFGSAARHWLDVPR